MGECSLFKLEVSNEYCIQRPHVAHGILCRNQKIFKSNKGACNSDNYHHTKLRSERLEHSRQNG